jgi:hypothetical protein
LRINGLQRTSESFEQLFPKLCFVSFFETTEVLGIGKITRPAKPAANAAPQHMIRESPWPVSPKPSGGPLTATRLGWRPPRPRRFAPDTKIKMHSDQDRADNYTAVTGVMEGTSASRCHTGRQSIPSTNKPFKLDMVTIGRWENGVMKEEWLFWDDQAFIKQIPLANYSPPLTAARTDRSGKKPLGKARGDSRGICTLGK